MAGVPIFCGNSVGGGSTTGLTVAWPTHATNDVAFLVCEHANQSTLLSTTAGFSLVASTGVGVAGSTTAAGINVWWCRATSAAMASPVIRDAGDHVNARIHVFSNVATAPTPYILASLSTFASNTAVSVAAVTVTQHNTFVLFIVADAVDNASTQQTGMANSVLSGFTTLFTSGTAEERRTTVGNGGGWRMTGGTLLVPGSSGAMTCTLAANSRVAALVIAIPGEPTVTGSGAMTIAVPTMAGTGTNTAGASPVTGTGAMSIASPTMAGTGSQAITGTGAMSFAPVLAGTGQQAHSGTGAVTIAVPTMAGTGQHGVSGTGAMSVSPAMAGTGTQAITGTGAMSVAPVLAGTGLRGNIGTGDLIVAPALSGTGQQQHSGTGAVTIPNPTMAGTGLRGNLGTGDLIVAPAFAGTGQQQHTGTGAISFAPVMDGTGSIGGVPPTPITGTGAMTIASPTMTAAGQQGHTGVGAVSFAPVLSGAGQQGHTATGAMSVSPVMAATGFNQQQVLASGAISFAPVLSGTGLRGNVGTGDLTITLVYSVSGTVVNPTGISGKYAPEHASALADLGEVDGYAPEHASALADLGDVTNFAAEHASALRDLMDAGI